MQKCVPMSGTLHKIWGRNRQKEQIGGRVLSMVMGDFFKSSQSPGEPESFFLNFVTVMNEQAKSHRTARSRCELL